jgi:hypothetical protein
MLRSSSTSQLAQARQSAAKAGSVGDRLDLEQIEQALKGRVKVGVDTGEYGVKLRHHLPPLRRILKGDLIIDNPAA